MSSTMMGLTAARAARSAAGSSARQFHASTVTKAGSGGGYDYLHAKYMYNYKFKPASKLKAGSFIFGGVALGIGIPLFAVEFNQRKAGLK